jgi:hypothetical protein
VTPCKRSTEEWEYIRGVAEWLFQNISQLVIQEAERQIQEEAFPDPIRAKSNSNSNSNSTISIENTNPAGDIFQRCWPGMSEADSLLADHGAHSISMRRKEQGPGNEADVHGRSHQYATHSFKTPDELA